VLTCGEDGHVRLWSLPETDDVMDTEPTAVPDKTARKASKKDRKKDEKRDKARFKPY